MESTSVGELVKVVTGGQTLDGIVFDTPSAKKVVVVLFDPGRGPVLRTVHPEALSMRATESIHDRALRMLVRRTPHPAHGAPRDPSRAGRGRAGHTRAATHRTSDH